MSQAAIGAVQSLIAHLAVGSDPAPAPDITSILHQIQESVISTGRLLLQTVDDTVVSLARVAFVTLLVLGFFLYFTHLHRRLGKDLMVGGIALVIISQFVLPFISRI